MDSTQNESTRAELMKLTGSGDLLDLARQLREMGVESILMCRSDGRIERVVTDRQIAHLATWHSKVDLVTPVAAARPRPAELRIPAQALPTHLAETSPPTRSLPVTRR